MTKADEGPVLVAGGSGLIGTATVSALTARGRRVRLLSRHAVEDARRWESGVEPFTADVLDPGALRASADGCDAMLVSIGIVKEAPPEQTFQAMNVDSVERLLREAERAGVRRFVFVSSLGAERGKSPYHRSKLEAEQLVRAFDGSWTIARVGNVFGPGDEVISMLLQLVRTLPVVPTIGSGDQPFQPVWHVDVGNALAELVAREDLSGEVLELAGGEQTTVNALLERLGEITDRHPAKVPVPSFIAKLGLKLGDAAGIDLPLSENHIQMLIEENVVRSPRGNALETVLGVTPTPLDVALRELADAAPEQLPDDGSGALKRKRYWTLIEGATIGAEELCRRVCDNFARVAPADTGVEPGTPTALTVGATLTLHLPFRGNIQVRCEEITPTSISLVTLAGHPLAGLVRFQFESEGDAIRCEIATFVRAANAVDRVLMQTVGEGMQERAWTESMQRIVALSGGRAAQVRVEKEEVRGDREAALTAHMRELVNRRKRDATSRSRATDREND
ncbi:MAG TPA: NAD(P)H-binding protein [Gemmatimonadales bacterium]|nr:NAD(P)H-binding protein [Gemmatimonadales bacterium]